MSTRLKIGELASKSGLSRDTIRFYERKALLPQPEWAPSGYRLYSPDVIERLLFIKQAQALGFSLTEIRDVLSMAITMRQSAGKWPHSSVKRLPNWISVCVRCRHSAHS